MMNFTPRILTLNTLYSFFSRRSAIRSLLHVKDMARLSRILHEELLSVHCIRNVVGKVNTYLLEIQYRRVHQTLSSVLTVPIFILPHIPEIPLCGILRPNEVKHVP